MSEDERTSPDLDDGPSNGSPLRAATVVVIGLGLFGLVWLGWQQLHRQACEKRSESVYQIASYDDRLALREITGVAEGAHREQVDWTDIRPRLDEYEREWMSLRNRACVERDTALVRCLDNQAGRLAVQIDAWVRGDPSWATDDLDEAIPAPKRCLED